MKGKVIIFFSFLFFFYAFLFLFSFLLVFIFLIIIFNKITLKILYLINVSNHQMLLIKFNMFKINSPVYTMCHFWEWGNKLLFIIFQLVQSIHKEKHFPIILCILFVPTSLKKPGRNILLECRNWGWGRYTYRCYGNRHLG